MYSKYTDLLPKEVLNEDIPELQKPDEEVIKEVGYSVSVYFWGNVQIVVRSTYSRLYIFQYLIHWSVQIFLNILMNVLFKLRLSVFRRQLRILA